MKIIITPVPIKQYYCSIIRYFVEIIDGNNRIDIGNYASEMEALKVTNKLKFPNCCDPFTCRFENFLTTKGNQ